MKKNQNAIRNKNEKRKARNRRFAGVLAFVLVAVMVLSIIAPLLIKGAENSSPQIEISGELGFLRKYKVYGSTPVKIYLENKGADFKGELQLRIAKSDDTSYVRNTVYACPVELSSGMVKSYDMIIEIPVIKTSFEVVVVNDKDVAIAAEALDASAVDPSGIMIGALTDDRNSLNYFRQMPLNSMGIGNQSIIDDMLIFLDESEMPDNVSVMNNFNYFIINNFDTGRLSEKQLDALAEWVNTGGVLLLGGGPNYSKVFKGLGNIVQTDSGGKAQLTSLDGLEKSVGKKIDLTSPIVLERINAINAPESIELMEEGGESLITAIRSSNGRIIIHNFDLGIAPIPEINRATGLLEQFYLPYVSETISYKSSVSNDYYSPFYNSNILLSTDDMSRLYLIFIVIGLYCVVIGPVLYIILKRKDMREAAIIIIPSVALVTILVIGAVTFSSTYRQPISSTNSLIILEDGSGEGSIESVTNVYSPSKNEIKLNFDKNIPIKSIDNRYYYGGPYISEADEKKIIFGDKTEITYYSKEKWDSSSFKSSGNIDINGNIECEFSIEGGDLVGVIKNNTDMDFYDVIVGIANGYEKYDFLGGYETIEIKQPLPEDSYMMYAGSYISQIYREGNFLLTDLSARERQVLRIRENMLDYFVSNRNDNSIRYSYSYGTVSTARAVNVGSYYTPSAQVIYSGGISVGGTNDNFNDLLDVSVYCFNYDVLNNYELKINGHAPTNFNVNLFKIEAGIDFVTGSFIRIPSGMIKTELEAGVVEVDFYDSANIYTHNEGDLIFNYTIPGRIEPQAFWIEWDINNNPLTMYGEAMLFNNRTDEWDAIGFMENDMQTIRFDSVDIKSYVSDDMHIRMKAASKSGMHIRMPVFGVEGIINENTTVLEETR